MPYKHDADIDTTLSAIRNASPPDDLEARIRHRLRYRSAQPTPSVSWLPGRTWWTGLLTGSAVATLVCSAMLLILRGRALPPASANTAVAQRRAALAVSSTEPDCASPRREPAVHRRSESRHAPQLIHASASERKPDTLTRQERELVRLAQIADPKQLASVSFEARAKIDEQESAAFKRYFTPPPPPPHDEGVNE